MVRRMILLALVGASCGAPVASTVPDPTAVFDVSRVRDFWTDECANPQFVDPDVCDDISVATMRGDGKTLFVPTTLSSQDHTEFNRAQNACIVISFGGLGYELVTILDPFGAPIFTCEVNPT